VPSSLAASRNRHSAKVDGMDRIEADTERLLERACAGDKTAVEDLLELHRDRLRRMVTMRLDDQLAARVDASDVVQETMITAHANIDHYLRTQVIAFYPWLRRIAWERLIDLRRKHLKAERRSVRRECSLEGVLPDHSAVRLIECLATTYSSPSEHLVRRELRQRVHEALRMLSARNREVLILRFIEQLSTRDAADILSISESALKGRQVRALEQLRSYLDDPTRSS
jgi:RNA polymerase sigma-70 factor (ECF subfamily)